MNYNDEIANRIFKLVFVALCVLAICIVILIFCFIKYL